MTRGRLQQAVAALVVAGVGVAVSACGSTKIVTVTDTVVQQRTTTVMSTASTSSSAPDTVPTSSTSPGSVTTASTTTTAPAPVPPPGTAPALNGAYTLHQSASGSDIHLPSNPHDGLWNADTQWTFRIGSCEASKCRVDLRRTLADSTIEDLVLFSSSPAGVYTGTIPGGDGHADCGAPVKLSVIVRIGGLENLNGQTTATRLAGHIFADFQCAGDSAVHDVATYVGTHT